MEENLFYIIINIALFTVNCATLAIGLAGWKIEHPHICSSAGACIVFSLLGLLASSFVIIDAAYALFSL